MNLALDRVGEVYKGEIFSREAQEMCRDRIDWVVSQANGSSVLDLGCSQGIVPILLASNGFDVLGVDIHPDAIAYAEDEKRRLPHQSQVKVRFLNDNLFNLSTESLGTFDSVILGEVIEHFVNPREVVNKACSFLADGGRLILTTPFGFFPSDDHKSTFTLSTLTELMPTGISVESIAIKGLYIRLVARRAVFEQRTLANVLATTEDGLLQAQRILHERLHTQRQATKNYQHQLKETQLKLKETQLKRKATEQKNRELIGEIADLRSQLKSESELEELKHKHTEKLRAEIGDLKAQLKIMRNSFAFRIGRLLVNACKSKDGILKLPKEAIQIMRDALGVVRRNRRTKRNAARWRRTPQTIRADIEAAKSSAGWKAASDLAMQIASSVPEQKEFTLQVAHELLSNSSLTESLKHARAVLSINPRNKAVVTGLLNHASIELQTANSFVIEQLLNVLSRAQLIEFLISDKDLFGCLQKLLNDLEVHLTEEKRIGASLLHLVVQCATRNASVLSSDFYDRLEQCVFEASSEGDADNLIKLAKASIQLNRLHFAECLLLTVKECAFGGSKIFCELSKFYRNTGRYTEAMANIEQAVAMEPSNEAYRHIAELLRGDLAVYTKDFWPKVAAGEPRCIDGIHKVLHVLENSLPHKSSGYTIRSQYVLKNQTKMGFEPIAITKPGFPADLGNTVYLSEDTVDGIKYVRSQCSGEAKYNHRPFDGFLQEYAEEVRTIAQAYKPDLIHAASNFKNAMAGLTVASALKLPFVYELRGLWEDTQVSKGLITEDTERYKFFRTLETKCLKVSNAIVTISESQKEEICARGISEEKVFVVHNAVETELFPIVQRDKDLEAELGVVGCKVAGYISSLVAYEGIDILLKAFVSIKEKVPNAKLLIVGDGDCRSSLKSLAESLGIAQDVIFTGKVKHTDILRYYSLIDLFVIPRLPYRVCRFVTPLKPYEAMSTGRALLVSNVEALRSMIIEGETGTVFEAGEPESLAAVASELLNNDLLRESLGVNAASWVRENRTWSRVVEAYRDTYGYALTAFKDGQS
jgi:PEP-CTERM/exosortase A-associated glycosyltransferase